MKFVYPEFLWALLLLVVPIIIHLFSFRKHRILYFSSLQFIQQIEQQNKSIQKLKHLLLLLCRLLALACIIIAFAQPYFPNSNRGATATKTVLAIHIDNSFSMTMRGVEGELLSEAIETARKLIDQTPLNGKIMLSTNVLDGVESRLCTKLEALERLDRVGASPMNRSYDEVVKWQKENLSKASKHESLHDVQFVYLSDFQKSTQSFENLEKDADYNYIPIRFQSQDPTNLSVDSVWFASPLHKVGVNNELFVKVSNHGQVSLKNVSLHFESETLQRDLFIDLDAHKSAVTSLTFSPKKTGICTGKISVVDKQFFADDDYFFTYTVNEHSKILIVNGQDAHPSVAKIYQLDDFYTVQQIQQTAFTTNLLQDINLVVLNGVNDISSGLHVNLIEYSQNRGTIAVFPGKNIQNNSINRLLSELHLPSLAKLTTQNVRIRKLNYNDPFFRGVFDEQKDNLSLPGVTGFYLIGSKSGSNAMSVVELQNGKTLLYRNEHPNQAFLFTSILSSDYGSFLTDILYTTVLLRMGELSLMHAPLAVTIGKTVNFPIYHNVDENYPLIMKGEKSEFIPEKRTLAHSTSIDLSGVTAMLNLQSGFFDVENNQHDVGKIAMNYDRVESQIDTWTESEIKSKLREANIRRVNIINVSKGASTTPLRLKTQFPYWKILIVTALLLLFAEMCIHKYFKK